MQTQLDSALSELQKYRSGECHVFGHVFYKNVGFQVLLLFSIVMWPVKHVITFYKTTGLRVMRVLITKESIILSESETITGACSLFQLRDESNPPIKEIVTRYYSHAFML